MSENVNQRPETNWIPFTAVLLLFVGFFNIIDGIAALSKDELFKVDELLFGDLTTWGWIWLVLGVLQALTSYLVFNRKRAGMVMAVTWAFFACMGHLLAVGLQPIWSIAMVTLSFMIMFGLLTNSDQFE